MKKLWCFRKFLNSRKMNSKPQRWWRQLTQIFNQIFITKVLYISHFPLLLRWKNSPNWERDINYVGNVFRGWAVGKENQLYSEPASPAIIPCLALIHNRSCTQSIIACRRAWFHQKSISFRFPSQRQTATTMSHREGKNSRVPFIHRQSVSCVAQWKESEGVSLGGEIGDSTKIIHRWRCEQQQQLQIFLMKL